MSSPTKIDRTVRSVFYALIAVFIFILAQFFIPAVTDRLRGPLLFLAPFAIFFSLGIALVVLTLKKKVEGKLKKFLILTGASAAGIFISVVLHNLIYGLLIVLFGPDFWDQVGLGDEPIFFLIGTLICPLAFLIGAITSLTLLLKNRPSNPQ